MSAVAAVPAGTAERARKRRAAQRLLGELLADGSEVPETVVRRAAESIGVRSRTLATARADLGVRWRRDGWQGPILLHLPAPVRPEPADRNDSAQFLHGEAAIRFLQARERWRAVAAASLATGAAR